MIAPDFNVIWREECNEEIFSQTACKLLRFLICEWVESGNGRDAALDRDTCISQRRFTCQIILRTTAGLAITAGTHAVTYVHAYVTSSIFHCARSRVIKTCGTEKYCYAASTVACGPTKSKGKILQENVMIFIAIATSFKNLGGNQSNEILKCKQS